MHRGCLQRRRFEGMGDSQAAVDSSNRLQRMGQGMGLLGTV